MFELIIFYCFICYLVGAGITIAAWSENKNNNKVSSLMFFASPIMVPILIGYILIRR